MAASATRKGNLPLPAMSPSFFWSLTDEGGFYKKVKAEGQRPGRGAAPLPTSLLDHAALARLDKLHQVLYVFAHPGVGLQLFDRLRSVEFRRQQHAVRALYLLHAFFRE